MMRPIKNAAARWRDRRPGKVTLEDRAATLMQIALPPDEPDAAVLARVQRRLFGERRQPLRRHLVFRLAVVALALVAGGASVKAYEWVRQVALPKPRTAPSEQPERARIIPGRRTAKATAVEAAQPSSQDEVNPADERPPASHPFASPLPATTRPAPATHAAVVDHELSTSPPPVAPPALPATALAPAGPPSAASSGLHRPAPAAVPALATDEITALDQAMALLRRDHDAKAALAALDDYLRRYPNGFLYREALSGKVDALLLLHRSDEALATLETFPFDNHHRSIELQVIRGELRARKDCTRAIADFDGALGRGPDAALLERILYGSGNCRAKTGDQQGAAADLRRYVERFPAGSQAGWARRWLESNATFIPQGR